MRVLILGGAGMLGHKLWQECRNQFETWLTVRSSYRDYQDYGLYDPQKMLEEVDAFDFDTVVKALNVSQPEVIINCIGVIKQLPTARDPIVSLTVNSLFPHRLANLCQTTAVRLIHISTDCIFSGRKGMYTEDDISDAEDLYGRTKFLGEVSGRSCLTLRSSILGRELNTSNGLVEWFLSNRGSKVFGYTKAIYSGFTTLAFAKVIADVIERQPQLSGVYNVSSEPISKYEILCLLREAYNLEIEIEPDEEVQINRSLDSSRFRAGTGFVPEAWPDMIQEMSVDPTPYENWRHV